VEGNRARGVRYAARQGRDVERREVLADVVISDAGAATTYGKLLGRGGSDGAARVDRLGGSMANVTLYLGLRESPVRLGLTGGNRWIYQSWDHEETVARAGELLEGKAVHAYLSFPSLKDPRATAHTAEVISAVPWEPFLRWRGMPWKKRGAEYQALKDRIADAMLDLVESRHPGFRDLVAYRELSTPLTNEHFTGHARGAIYGAPGVPERWKVPELGPRTSVKGLWLAGADAASLGILGALMGGVLATAGVLGLRGVPRIMAAARSWTGPGPKASSSPRSSPDRRA
jgi:phytoene dehydrogenase-like protein